MESAVPGAGAALLLYARGEFVRAGAESSSRCGRQGAFGAVFSARLVPTAGLRAGLWKFRG